MRLALSLFILITLAMPSWAQDKAKPNTLTPKEIADGWILLFDGETMFGLTSMGNVKVANGELVIGDGKISTVMTTSSFADYEVQFESNQAGKGFFHPGWEASRKSMHDNAFSEGWYHNVLRVRGSTGTEDSYEYKSPAGGGGGVGRKQGKNPVPWGASHVVIATDEGLKVSLRNIKLRPLSTKSLFNGKDLDGWKVFPKKKSEFAVVDGAINVKNGPGDLQSVGKYGDFVLQLDCICNGKNLNSGIFFRCKDNEYQNGYEAQILNKFSPEPKQKYSIEEYDPKTNKLVGKKEILATAFDFGTGAIYRRVPARKEMSKDGEWFGMTILAHGNHFATWVNGVQVTDWTDNRPKNDNPRNGCRLEAGHISIQGHDPTTNLSFKNLRIAEMK